MRFGAVSYLNTKPLIYGLLPRLVEVLGTETSLQLDLPSRLAARLKADELDVALIPSVEFHRSDDLQIVSNACIACRGEVRSVRLLFRKPPAQVKTMALDEGSRTSCALAQILLAREFGIRPQLSPLALSDPYWLADADAIVVIGDRAMSIDQGNWYETWDLGQRWLDHTGLPFVFAMWVSKQDAVRCIEPLQSARDDGLANVEKIVAVEAIKHGLNFDDCKRYFQQQLYFHLGPQELAGLYLFRDYAQQLGLLHSLDKTTRLAK